MYAYVPFKMDFSHIPSSHVFRVFQRHDLDLKGVLTVRQAKDAVTQLRSEDPTAPPLYNVTAEFNKSVLHPVGLVEFFKCLHFRELVSQWELLFRKVDTRQTGFLTAADFLGFFRESELENPEEELNTFFHIAQKDLKETFSFDEFVALLAFASPLVMRGAQSEEKILELKTAFRTYDPDGKGYIEEEQLDRMLKELHLEQDLEVIRNWLNTNMTTSLTLAKFFELMGYGDEVALYQTAFKAADANQTGLIEEGELAQLLQTLDIQKPGKEAHKILIKNKRVGSGLDFDQFVNFMLDYGHTDGSQK